MDFRKIKKNFLDKKKTIKIYPENEVLIMSSFLPHRTTVDYRSHKSYWRLGISTRYDDLKCKIWKKNNFISAYSTVVDRKLIKSIEI